MRLMDAVLSFPPLVLALALGAVLGAGLTGVLIALGVVYTPTFARLMRGQVLSDHRARVRRGGPGAGRHRLAHRRAHVLPNAVTPIVVQASLSVAFAILAEASLSFLGLGIQPPAASWGSMINAGRGYLQQAPWIVFGAGRRPVRHGGRAELRGRRDPRRPRPAGLSQCAILPLTSPSGGGDTMAIAPQVTTEPIPTADYARLEERIIARDQKGASDVLYRLMKQGRPVTEITRETVRIHAPYTHVPYHQRLDDGVVKFVNNDHCLLSERVGLPLRSMIRPELAWLPMAQTVWYMPTGLDPWNQLLGKAPGHYTRLYDLTVNTRPPMPQLHWPDQEPVPTEGTAARAPQSLAHAGAARRGAAVVSRVPRA